MRKIIVSALAGLSLALFAAAASAETETTSVAVKVADLNLAHPIGMATLESRIERAIVRVCGDETRRLKRVVSQERCVEETRAAVQAQVARRTRDRNLALNR